MEVDMNQLTKIALTWELYEEDIPKTHIAERLGVHRETVRTWISGISSNTLGLTGFIEEYQKAKKGQRRKQGLLRTKDSRIYIQRFRTISFGKNDIQSFG